MANSNPSGATRYPGQYPHVEWIDLENNNTLTEVAVLGEDRIGNIKFIKLQNLDTIDKSRMVKILTTKHAARMPLWESMANTTLNNGANALEYFHQLVRVRTPNGQISRPQFGVTGIPVPGPTPPQDFNKMAMNQAAAEAAEGQVTAEPAPEQPAAE